LSPPKTRTRAVEFPFGDGTVTGTDFNPQTGQTVKVGPTRSSMGSIKGRQTTVSEGHPFRSRKTGDVRDLGGNFYTTRQYAESKGISTSGSNVVGTRTRHFVGPVSPIRTADMFWPPTLESTNGSLVKQGTTAIARCKPTNSVADAATFLGELYKDGLPHLVGSQTWKPRTKAAKKAADEFLNVEFGWRPLVNDVRNFAYAVHHANTVLTQYERDAGRSVRRTYRFPIQRSVDETLFKSATRASYAPSDSILQGDNTPLGNVYRRREIVRSQWFSGSFTYSLPRGLDTRSTMGRYALEAKKLLGLSLTPETLWNIAPWSWAVDWFSNTGDVISNLSDWASDGLVMHYGYMMEKTIVKDTYSITPSGIQAFQSVPNLTLVTETKQRIRANPFGFGLSFDGLSTIQKAILAALGISRSL